MKVSGNFINSRKSEKTWSDSLIFLIINITDSFFSLDYFSEINIDDLSFGHFDQQFFWEESWQSCSLVILEPAFGSVL